MTSKTNDLFVRIPTPITTKSSAFSRGFDNLIQHTSNKRICEAINCYSEATELIQLDAGKFGHIPLFFCKKCVSKFRD